MPRLPYKIDSGPETHLPICLACHWRGPVLTSRLSALAVLDAHQRHCHPGHIGVSNNLARARRRFEI